MAKIPAPKKLKSSKGQPPKEKNSSKNLEKRPKIERVALNFSVDADFRKALKSAALEEEISMVELLKKMFDFYQNRD